MMSAREIRKELEKIAELVNSRPDGIRADEINEFFENALEPRKLQRRLASLLEQQSIRREGTGRGSLYFPIQQSQSGGHRTERDPTPGQIELSSLGQQIQKQVNHPLEQRNTVGYNREFLESYDPNRSFYLTDNQRAHLRKIGKQDDDSLPAGTFARRIFQRLLIDLSWNSSRLEGNTYSLLETEQLIQNGNVIETKSAAEAQMILNHKRAIEFLVEKSDLIDFNATTVCNIHGMLSDNLLGNPAASGRLRTIPVGIGRTAYRPTDLPQLIEETFQNILSKASQIKDPFEQSFFIMVHLPYLQPFEDVNKRTSRLSANIPFIKHNYCPLSFVDVPKKLYVESIIGVYEFNQVELLADVYMWAYERSTRFYSELQQTVGQPDPFRMRYREAIAHVVKDVVEQQLSKSAATKKVQEWAGENIPVDGRQRFIGVVESELLGLHGGNIFRYNISSTAFEPWQEHWKKES